MDGLELLDEGARVAAEGHGGIRALDSKIVELAKVRVVHNVALRDVLERPHPRHPALCAAVRAPAPPEPCGVASEHCWLARVLLDA